LPDQVKADDTPAGWATVRDGTLHGVSIMRFEDPAAVRATLRHFLENGLISSCMWAGELMIAESDYLVAHKAACEGPFLPLSGFNPAFVDFLRAEHAAELVVRSSLVCVPWKVVNYYTTPGASPLDWELDPRDIPMHGPV
jgi:hypothetical protein